MKAFSNIIFIEFNRWLGKTVKVWFLKDNFIYLFAGIVVKLHFLLIFPIADFFQVTIKFIYRFIDIL